MEQKKTIVEESVLATFFTMESYIELPVCKKLKPEHFANPKNGIIFSAMLDSKREFNTIDYVSVFTILKSKYHEKDYGSVLNISKLGIDTPYFSFDMVEIHVAGIIDSFIRRKLIDISNRNFNVLTNDKNDVHEALAIMTKEVENLNNFFSEFKTETKEDVINNTVKTIENRVNTGMQGFTTGFYGLDTKVGGLDFVGITIIAGRPGVGKTNYSLSSAMQQVLQGKKVAFFSLEMSPESVYEKMISLIGNIPTWAMKSGKLNPKMWESLYKTASDLIKQNFQCFGDGFMNLEEIVSKCRVMKQKDEVDIIYIDYLQLIGTMEKKGNREQEISYISRTLKRLAMSIKCPVVALSQLNRQVENRADKMPNLSDLRESGSLEQDASSVFFVSRPSMYDIFEIQGQPITSDEAVLICAKNRFGKINSIIFSYRDEYNQEWHEGELHDLDIEEQPNNLLPNLEF